MNGFVHKICANQFLFGIIIVEIFSRSGFLHVMVCTYVLVLEPVSTFIASISCSGFVWRDLVGICNIWSHYMHHGDPSKGLAQTLKVTNFRTVFYFFYVVLPFCHEFERIVCISMPSQSTCVRTWQKYHLNHHFTTQSKGFGINLSLFWDNVFGTLLRLPKAAEKNQ